MASNLGYANSNMHLPISSKSLNTYKATNINTFINSNKILYSNNSYTCYNLFFILHNLLLLKENVSLGSFLIHLSNHSFSQLFYISINHTLTETHIYLNLYETKLINHTILNPSQFSNYYYLTIRTNITTNNTIENSYLNLNIASININGQSSPHKQLSLLDIINQNNYNIFGISETHLSI